MCVADHVGMLENSYLSVIAPEACASIIFRDKEQAAEAAEALKLTAEDLLAHGIIDEVLPEPLGGAHNEPEGAVDAVVRSVEGALAKLSKLGPDSLVKSRHERYRRIGAHLSEGEAEGKELPLRRVGEQSREQSSHPAHG